MRLCVYRCRGAFAPVYPCILEISIFHFRVARYSPPDESNGGDGKSRGFAIPCFRLTRVPRANSASSSLVSVRHPPHSRGLPPSLASLSAYFVWMLSRVPCNRLGSRGEKLELARGSRDSARARHFPKSPSIRASCITLDSSRSISRWSLRPTSDQVGRSSRRNGRAI